MKLSSITGGCGRHSNRPRGVTIADEFRSYFEGGEVLLGCNGFLRQGHRTESIKCYKTLWFEEMKLPELPKE